MSEPTELDLAMARLVDAIREVRDEALALGREEDAWRFGRMLTTFIDAWKQDVARRKERQR
jgi:hypothetical protein